jgi:hypothetical protein
MAGTYSIDLRGSYVEVVERGEISVALRDEIRKAAAAVCAESGVHRLLVDLTEAKMRFGVMAADDFAQRFLAAGFEPTARIAYVARKDDLLARFVADVVGNWTSIHCDVFTRREDALTWLLSSPAVP